MKTHIQTCRHAHTYPRTHSHACTCEHTYAHAFTHTYTHKYTHTHMHVKAHTQAHKHTGTHTRTHALLWGNPFRSPGCKEEIGPDGGQFAGSSPTVVPAHSRLPSPPQFPHPSPGPLENPVGPGWQVLQVGTYSHVMCVLRAGGPGATQGQGGHPWALAILPWTETRPSDHGGPPSQRLLGPQGPTTASAFRAPQAAPPEEGPAPTRSLPHPAVTLRSCPDQMASGSWLGPPTSPPGSLPQRPCSLAMRHGLKRSSWDSRSGLPAPNPPRTLPCGPGNQL